MTHLCFLVTKDLAGPQNTSEQQDPLCFVPSWEGDRPATSSYLGPLSFFLGGPWLLGFCWGLLAVWPSWPLCLSGSVLTWIQPKLPLSNLETPCKGSLILPQPHPSAVVSTGMRSLPAFLLWLPPVLLGEALLLPLLTRWQPHLARGLCPGGSKANSSQAQGRLWMGGWGGDRVELCHLSPKAACMGPKP